MKKQEREKKWRQPRKASFVLRIECGTTEFETEVLTTTQCHRLLGFLFRYTDQMTTVLLYDPSSTKRYQASALTQFWKVRKPAQNFITLLRRPARTTYPLLAFVSCFMEIKHRIAQSVQWLGYGGTTCEAGLLPRWGQRCFSSEYRTPPTTEYLGFFLQE